MIFVAAAARVREVLSRYMRDIALKAKIIDIQEYAVLDLMMSMHLFQKIRVPL